MSPLCARAGALLIAAVAASCASGNALRPEDVAHAERLVDLGFTSPQRWLMLEALAAQRASYRELRKLPLPNELAPALRFAPSAPAAAPREPLRVPLPAPHSFAKLEELAFAPVTELAALLRARKVTSVELTTLFLERLERYGPTLACLVSVTRERALEAARRADAELAAGKDRGPLHGIPYGVKDLFATRDAPTSWGVGVFRARRLAADAAVVRRLEEAGAVLAAKLSMGELAMGPIWFGGRTRNPWNLRKSSGGSSAGPGAAVGAGLVPFAIGTETWGSIMSPASRCGVTGLRPTFGRVSRAGAMALAWSLDKVGPLCRTAEDCALVLQAIAGADPEDADARDAPLRYERDVDLAKLRFGYLADELEKHENAAAALEALRKLGAKPTPVRLAAYPFEPLGIILSAEAAAAFDEFLRGGQAGKLVQQGARSWPNFFRASRFIPAVEYLQANRLRALWVAALHRTFSSVDVLVTRPLGKTNLITNMTGNPCVGVPTGMGGNGLPTAIAFCGAHDAEGLILAVARRFQEATTHHRAVPPRFR